MSAKATCCHVPSTLGQSDETKQLMKNYAKNSTQFIADYKANVD